MNAQELWTFWLAAECTPSVASTSSTCAITARICLRAHQRTNNAPTLSVKGMKFSSV